MPPETRSPDAATSIGREVRVTHARQALVDITHVLRLPSDTGLVSEHHLEAPVAGTTSPVHGINLTGWAVGTGERLLAIEVTSKTGLVAEMPVGQSRPDVARAYPGRGGVDGCGFSGAISVIGLPTNFDLTLCAVTSDSGRVPLWQVLGARRNLVAADPTAPQPLLVTTLGRSGSKWLMQLLASHGSVVAYRSQRLEARVVGYWTSVLLELAKPSSYREAMFAGVLAGSHWWAGDRLAGNAFLEDANLESWLGSENIEVIARFSISQVRALYSFLVESEGKKHARYVAEKSTPHLLPELARELFPETRQIVLVRDFRDMMASALAFSRRHGRASFGRERVDNDLDFPRQVRENAIPLLESWRTYADTSHLVRYEDLVREPVRTISDVFQYLGLDTKDATVREIVERNRWDSSAAWHATSPGPIESIGRWRRELSDEMKERAQAELGPALEAFGYDVA